MIVPDANLLIYAYDSTSPHHSRAAAWWAGVLSGSEPVGIPTVVIFAFMRLVSSPVVFARPMTATEAAGHVRSWLGRPSVETLDVSATSIERALGLLEEVGTAGNLVTDAQIAALAMEHDAIVSTNDADFARFPGLRTTNPLVTADPTRKARRRPS